MKKVYILFFSFAFLVTTLQAQNALPIYEPFQLSLGTLGGQNSWTGPTGTDLGAQVVDSNLLYTGLPVTNSYAVRVGNQASGAIQQLNFPPQNTKTYASFLIRLSVMPPTLIAGSYYLTMGNGQTPGGTMYAIPNANGTTFELGFNTLAAIPLTQNTTNRNFTLGQTIMVVMAFTPATTAGNGTGNLSVWINPSATDIATGANEPTPTFTGITGGNLANVANVFIRSGSNTRSMIFDELRIGNNWSEVTTNTNPLLPASISELNLATKSNITTINWISETEINFDKYVVLFSNNGTEFKEIGSVKGTGSNSKYSFKYAHTGNGYFKLKLIDKDGSYTYSKVLFANSKTLAIKVGPNPFSDRIIITGMPEGLNTLVLYNSLGVAVKREVTGNNSLTMPISKLAAGNYFLTISNNGTNVYSTRIIK